MEAPQTVFVVSSENGRSSSEISVDKPTCNIEPLPSSYTEIFREQRGDSQIWMSWFINWSKINAIRGLSVCIPSVYLTKKS